MTTFNWRHNMISAVVAATAAVAATMMPVAAEAPPNGPIREEFSYGYFYGTFDQTPNVTALAGGTAEEFCLDNPDDPFNGEPGTAPSRVFVRDSGRVDIKVDDKNQPIYLYHQPDVIGPEWIEAVCADFFDGDPTTRVPEPFASGTAKVRVRLGIISDDLVNVFNSINGRAVSNDGTLYRVAGSADLVVENGVPIGDPTDFVRLRVTELRQCWLS